MPKILTFSIIEENKQEEDVSEVGRILNVHEIELCFLNNLFYIQTDMGTIALNEGDRILINKTLLKISYRYTPEELNHEDYNSDYESFNYLEDHTDNLDENHPLAFLFNNNFREK